MIKVGIIGGAGYTAGELLRLLLNHPQVTIEWVHSSSNAGRPVSEVHAGLEGDTHLCFSHTHPLHTVDVVFLCSGHGKSSQFWAENTRPEGLRVIDLAQDFRDGHDGYVYGLPEVNRTLISGASLVANPGCYATAIQLALLPLAAAQQLPQQVNITGITGSTGAGVKPGVSTHFSWRNHNLSVYKPFTHQHLLEIGRTLRTLQPQAADPVFVPVRGDFARGIFIIATMQTPLSLDQLNALYSDYYAHAPFTHLAQGYADMKQVVNTNKCLIKLTKEGDNLLVTATIDNLLKGASGQAVQNMNLMFGLDEMEGLRLKPSAF